MRFSILLFALFSLFLQEHRWLLGLLFVLEVPILIVVCHVHSSAEGCWRSRSWHFLGVDNKVSITECYRLSGMRLHLLFASLISWAEFVKLFNRVSITDRILSFVKNGVPWVLASIPKVCKLLLLQLMVLSRPRLLLLSSWGSKSLNCMIHLFFLIWNVSNCGRSLVVYRVPTYRVHKDLIVFLSRWALNFGFRRLFERLNWILWYVLHRSLLGGIISRALSSL